MQARARVLLDARYSPFTLTRTLTRPRPGACVAQLTEGAAPLTPEQEYELALRTVHAAQRLWLMLLKRPSLQALAISYICKAPQQATSKLITITVILINITAGAKILITHSVLYKLRGVRQKFCELPTCVLQECPLAPTYVCSLHSAYYYWEFQ